MSYLEDIKSAADIELTTKENAALHRLKSNPDFAVFMDIITRWTVKRGFDLLRDPHEGQDASLLQHQGGYQLLKKMTEFVDNAQPATK